MEKINDESTLSSSNFKKEHDLNLTSSQQVMLKQSLTTTTDSLKRSISKVHDSSLSSPTVKKNRKKKSKIF